MEFLDFFMVATSTIGFILVCKNVLYFVKWVWGMFLRAPKNLKEYGSWAMITGSTDGIGKAMAHELASKGLNLLLVSRNPKKLEATSNEIRDKNSGNVEIKCLAIDFAKENGEEVMKRVEEEIEGLDVGILVNCAGWTHAYARYFHEVDYEMINGTIKVNVEGTIWVTKAVIPSMIKKKKGAIINLGSGSTFLLPSYPLFTVYAATKRSVEMFSRCINLEYRHKGIDIQCQVPLYVSTKLTKLGTSVFVPTPERYIKSCTRWIGYETVVVPYLLHSLQAFTVRAIPETFVDSYMLRYFLYWRKKGLFKDAKIKALEASKS